MPLLKDSDGILNEFKGVFVEEIRQDGVKNVSSLMDKIMLDCNLGKTSPLKALVDSWQDIIPKQFVHLCEPTDLGKTELYVRVLNSAAKQELIFQERKILKKIQALGGLSQIKKIRFL